MSLKSVLFAGAAALALLSPSFAMPAFADDSADETRDLNLEQLEKAMDDAGDQDDGDDADGEGDDGDDAVGAAGDDDDGEDDGGDDEGPE